MNKTIISIFLNIILITGIVYFFFTKNNTTEKPTDTNVKQIINEENQTEKLESEIVKNVITMDDINIMQEIGVLVSFENDKKAYKIPSDMTPDRLLEANYLSFNNVELYVLPNWLAKMHNLLWLDLSGTKVTSEELQKLQGLKKLKFLNISGQEQIKAEEINLSSLLIGRDLERIKFSFDNEKKSHLTSLDITQKRLLEAKHINFNGTTILHLPNWFEQMDNLVRLDFNSVALAPSEVQKLGSLKYLKILDLTNNWLHLNIIIDVLKNLPLTELTLENTKGTSENYKNIGDISTLVKLNLSRNLISDLELLHLEKLVNLKKLNLSANKLSDNFNSAHLPKKSLIKLDLSLNNIAVFAFNGDFPQLEFLDISNLNISDNKRRLSFDAKYGGAFILNKIKQVIVNNDVGLPDGLWKKLTKDILPEIIAYGKITIIEIDGLEYRKNFENSVDNCVNDWRKATEVEVSKLKISNALKNSKNKEFYFRKEFVENINFYLSSFNDICVREKKISWLESPTSNICEENGGKFNNGICSANWDNATKICADMGGLLPTRDIFKKLFIDCKDKTECYKEKGLLSNIYWTKDTHSDNINVAWYEWFATKHKEYEAKSKMLSVHCVADTQKR